MSALDPIAESYVKLVLAVGLHDADYVDAFYGPEGWRHAVEAEATTLSVLGQRATSLIEQTRAQSVPEADEMLALRRNYLATQLGSLVARIELLRGADR